MRLRRLSQAKRGLNLKVANALSTLAFLLALSVPGLGESLRELLAKNGIPATKFLQQELDQRVQGTSDVAAGRTLLAYQALSGELIVPPLHLVTYESRNGSVVRADLPMTDDDLCNGSFEVFKRLTHFTVLFMHINPSAGCMLILDSKLELKKTVYGFDVYEVAPDQILVFEDMMHFAPVHPQRLEVVNLANRTATEIYPLKGDVWRARLIAEHAKKMPSPKICEESNDPCVPEYFDEDIRSVRTDGQGRFTFEANQSADHAPGKEQTPVTVVEQTVLYAYEWVPGASGEAGGWRFCAEKPADSAAAPQPRSLDQGQIGTHCQPSITVKADQASADFNPFPNN